MEAYSMELKISNKSLIYYSSLYTFIRLIILLMI